MTKDEALKQGVEALENIDRWLPTIGQKGLRDYEADALAAMKEALAQPAQEPSKFGSPELQAAILGKLYKSHPEIFQRPQRPWVGLTTEDMATCINEPAWDLILRKAEQILKEKNQ